MEEGREWLEADGLGGYAMGTLSSLRTRRYHALLLSARRPPSDRVRLVAGVEAWVETAAGRFALTSQRYQASVVHPDGATRVRDVTLAPWPTWYLLLPDGTELVHDLFVPSRRAAVMLGWRLLAGPASVRLFVRPLLAATDFHSLSHENTELDSRPVVDAGRVGFRPYATMPEIVALADARYQHDPVWYRGFEYAIERARGLDSVEDLWSPGVFEATLDARGVAVGFTTREREPELARDPRSALQLYTELASTERARRGAFSSPLARAASAYVVDRDGGRTVMAGYPWFGDWGRDTFIALRGLCLPTDPIENAAAVLEGWAAFVDQGMLPNRFPDAGDAPEYNSVDAALWYVVAARELLAHASIDARVRAVIEQAVRAIVHGHLAGARHGIGVDPRDGLLRAGVPGQQLTWMDARSEGQEVTPRIGKPVEVNALWLHALDFARSLDESLEPRFVQALASFRDRFPVPGADHLADVVDVDHRVGVVDATLRPNQIFAVGGLPFAPIEGEAARRVVDVVERALFTPMGLRSLARGAPGYSPTYEGAPAARDRAYHQGTVWPWLVGPFIDAWLRVRGDSAADRAEARRRFLAPLEAHLGEAGVGHVSEIADAEEPHTPRGCPFQAWSVGELRRALARTAPVGIAASLDAPTDSE